MVRTSVLVALLVAAAALPAAGVSPVGEPGTTVRVSVATGGAQARPSSSGAAAVSAPVVSADGRHVVFATDALGLAHACTATQRSVLGSQVYVRDLRSGVTELVSARPDGCPAFKGGSGGALATSADGRYVALLSTAGDLVPGAHPVEGSEQVYVRDRATRRTYLVSRGWDGRPSGARSSSSSPVVSISADGRYVAFDSYATGLLRGDRPGPHGPVSDVFVWDRVTGLTTRVGPDERATGFDKYAPSVSGNGRFVAYTDEHSGTAQVYVYDRAARTTKLVSATADGAPGDFDSTTARTGRAVSDDGRWVVFGSVATNLTMPAGVPGEQVAADPTPDVYLADRITSTVVRVSAGAGLVPGDGASAAASISGDGRSVVYQTVANDLGDVDLTSGYDVYGYDVTTLSSSLLSRASDGTQANADAYWPTVSRDGSVVAFASAATNLVPADTNGQPDVFVRARP